MKQWSLSHSTVGKQNEALNHDVLNGILVDDAGIPCQYTTPLQGLGAYGMKVVYEAGCGDVACQEEEEEGSCRCPKL